MAKAKATKVTTTATQPAVKHARIELLDAQYHRLKKAADRRGLPIAAYIRQAVLLAVEADEREASR